MQYGTASDYCYQQLHATANKPSRQQQLHLFHLTMQNFISGGDHQQGTASHRVNHQLTLPFRSIRSRKILYMTLEH